MSDKHGINLSLHKAQLDYGNIYGATSSNQLLYEFINLSERKYLKNKDLRPRKLQQTELNKIIYITPITHI